MPAAVCSTEHFTSRGNIPKHCRMNKKDKMKLSFLSRSGGERRLYKRTENERNKSCKYRFSTNMRTKKIQNRISIVWLGCANFLFVDSRYHLKQSISFPATVDAICNLFLIETYVIYNIYCKKCVKGTESTCGRSHGDV